MAEQVAQEQITPQKQRVFKHEHGSDAWSSCLQLQSSEFNEDS
jgi:hypothetical protein